MRLVAIRPSNPGPELYRKGGKGFIVSKVGLLTADSKRSESEHMVRHDDDENAIYITKPNV